MQHLPILIVLVPMAAALLCPLVGRRFSWGISLAATWTCFAIAVRLLQQVLADGTIDYEIGGWEAPWGIAYRVDLLGSLVLLIVSTLAALVITASRASIRDEIAPQRRPAFHTSLLLLITGLLGMTVTGDAFNLFVSLEVSSLATYTLIGLGKDRRALTAAFQYLVMGSIGATFVLIGIGFLYMMTGTLNMADLAARLPEVSDTRTVRVGFAFLGIGLGLKLALFPLHLWLPNAYAYAPSAVSALLASTATKVAAYVLIRFLLTVFGPEFALNTMPFDKILIALGLSGILSASLTAILQSNAKRLFAYSSVGQMGYVVLGIGIASSLGVSAAILHLANHALMKGALFLGLAAVMLRTGSVRVDAFRGMGKRMPWTMAAIAVAGLSLIGIPGTAGFLSKWYLLMATLDAGLWPLAVVILIGSLLAVAYVGRILEAAYLKQPEPGEPGFEKVAEAPLGMLIPIYVLVLSNLYFGMNTELTAGLAEQAAAALMEIAP